MHNLNYNHPDGLKLFEYLNLKTELYRNLPKMLIIIILKYNIHFYLGRKTTKER